MQAETNCTCIFLHHRWGIFQSKGSLVIVFYLSCRRMVWMFKWKLLLTTWNVSSNAIKFEPTTKNTFIQLFSLHSKLSCRVPMSIHCVQTCFTSSRQVGFWDRHHYIAVLTFQFVDGQNCRLELKLRKYDQLSKPDCTGVHDVTAGNFELDNEFQW